MCEILRIDGWRTVGIGITRGVVARRDCAATIRILPRGVLVEAAVFIGCDWSLSGVSMDDAAIRALSPKTASEAGGRYRRYRGLSGVHKSVARHVVISFFCFVHAKQELSSRPKLREADLDADSKETAAMAERAITRHVLGSISISLLPWFCALGLYPNRNGSTFTPLNGKKSTIVLICSRVLSARKDLVVDISASPVLMLPLTAPPVPWQKLCTSVVSWL